MVDSKFWRLLAVALVAGVFYLGHALHGGPAIDLPGLTTRVHAGDVATAVTGGNTAVKVITSSEDGASINVWQTYTTSNSVHFLGTFKAKPKVK